jgi:hypothetical protein
MNIVVDANGNRGLERSIKFDDLPALPLFDEQRGRIGIVVDGAVSLFVMK